MKNAGDLARENEALRERLSRLSEASLRINESLDFEAVLQGALDSACSLTGARYGVIALVGASGRIEDSVTSGLTSEEHRRFMDFPEGMSFFEYLNGISEPLRLRDFHSYMRSLGLPEFRPPFPVSSPLPFLSAPIRHLGENVGAIYVGEKDREFTAEDEETLVMFASQAALVIANARRHREEQRARADLETLVNTTPVGVVVFDARTGNPVSVNREARRIVNDLCAPGGSAEQLLEALTFRRADGREVSLEEFPLAQGLMTGETVRAEEIVLLAPDGRSVTTLVNATPIRSEEGEVVSVVVTMQDMTPLEDLERLRAEFLGMVSHELRTPLAAIKGSVDTLLEVASELDPAEMTQFFRIIRDQSESMRYLIGELLDVARIETGTLPVSPEPVEATVLVDEARSRFQSGGGRSNLVIDLPPALPRVLADRRRIVQVLSNLLSNAARHSNEVSAIRVAAARDGVHVAFSVADDGVGVDPERLPHLFRKFSRLDGEERGRETGGSGLGLAICKGIVEAHGGRIRAESDGLGLGNQVHLHPAGGGRASQARRQAVPATATKGTGADPHSLRGRRSADPPVRPGRPHPGGLRARGDRRPGGGLPPHEGGSAPPGPAGPGAAGRRRHRADAGDPRDRRRAGHLPVRLRPGRGCGPGLRPGSGRLRGQALLSDGAGGQNQGGPAQAGGAGVGPARRALRAGRPDRRLSPAPGDDGRTHRRAHRHRVPDAGRAFGQRRAAADPRASAATGLGTGQGRGLRAGEKHRPEAAPQAGRRRGQSRLYLRRAPHRLPDGEGRGAGAGGGVTALKAGDGATATTGMGAPLLLYHSTRIPIHHATIPPVHATG